MVIQPKWIISRIPIKHSMPMIDESSSLPVMNPPNTRWMCAMRAMMAFARSTGHRLYVIFLACAQNISLLLRMYSAMMTPMIRFISTLTVVTTPLIMLPSCGSRSFLTQSIICAENWSYRRMKLFSISGLLCKSDATQPEISFIYRSIESISEVMLVTSCGRTIQSSTPTTAIPNASVSALHRPLANLVPFWNLRESGGWRFRYSILKIGMSRYAITKP